MKVRRIIACLCALATVATATVAFASAASDTVTVSISNAEVAAGGEFELNVSLGGIPATGISAVDFAVKFDSSLVTISGVTEGAISKDTGASEAELAADSGLSSSIISDSGSTCFDYFIADGQIGTLWGTALGSDYWIKSDGVFMTIKGTVKDSVAPGTKISFDVVPTTRETYPGTGVQNSDVILGYSTDSGDVMYTPQLTSGIITVSGAETTTSETTTSETTTSETTVSETTTSETTVSETTTSETTVSETQASETTETTVVTDPTDTTHEGFVVMYGDVNLDEKINIGDIINYNKYLVGAVTFNAEQRLNADTVNDGELSIVDDYAIIKYICGTLSVLGPDLNN